MEIFSNGALTIMLLLAAALAFPISMGLIALYRRSVSKYMNARANSAWGKPNPFAAPVPAYNPVPALPNVAIFDRASPIPGGSSSALYGKMQFAKWRAAVIYALAGICYAFVMASAFMVNAGGFFPLRIILLTVIFAFPVVLTINIVAATNWFQKIVTALVYFFILLALSLFSLGINLGTPLPQIILLFFMMNLPGTILIQAFLMRKIRAVGPIVLIFMFIAVLGSQIAISVAGSSDTLLRLLAIIGAAVDLGAESILIGIVILGFIILSPVGWLALRHIGAWYERKIISDQSITLDAVWLTFGVTNSLMLASGGILWLLSGLFAFLVYRVVLQIGFALAGKPDEGRKLLVLRVFSLGKRSERLFRALGTHWRYAGSVRLIAGPDLASNTVEPHEFLDFVSGKLAQRFISSPQTFDLRRSEMDSKADWDGRFRVHDFLCYDDTWKMVLARLVRESDAVIMDLRGFSKQNSGCIYEINELISTAPLARIVFVIDHGTDGQFLFENIKYSWARMKPDSPNRFSQSAQLRLFRFTDSGGNEFRQLLRTLCAAAPNSTLSKT